MSTHASRPSFSFTVSTMIDAAPSQVWDPLVDLDVWWEASNPRTHRPRYSGIRAGASGFTVTCPEVDAHLGHGRRIVHLMTTPEVHAHSVLDRVKALLRDEYGIRPGNTASGTGIPQRIRRIDMVRTVSRPSAPSPSHRSSLASVSPFFRRRHAATPNGNPITTDAATVDRKTSTNP